MNHSLLRNSFAALGFALALLFQETWALAGTTGGFTGTVTNLQGAPIAGAAVKATSASQVASTKTDGSGHFVFLNLAPDTYTVSIERTGYSPLSVAGITVFADQTQTLAFKLQPALKTIARVTSRAEGALVKPGVGADIYNVNAAQAAAAAPLGGGGNLNSAYSAMASVPGIQTSIGGQGWDFNAAYVRGQNSYYTGYEYDGIPINRAFDNYNASTDSSLGLQELQVYTGGGPASIATSGTAGFVNQVIKTGTYPGYGTADLGIGTPTFYHQAQVDAGGSTPNRLFSYYVGLSGYNQGFRSIDNANGASLMQPGGIYSGDTLGFGIGYTNCATPTCQGVKPICPLVGQTGTPPPQGCWDYYNGVFGNPFQSTDREAVINLHFGILHKNGLRDDIQTLWSSSALNLYPYDSPADAGPGNAQFIQSLTGSPYAPPASCGPLSVTSYNYLTPANPTGVIVPGAGTAGLTVDGCSGGNYLPYADGVAYNLPFGTTISANNTSITPPSPYYAPDTPQHAFNGPQPLFDEGLNVNQNDTGIVKLQYTHEFSDSAYLRAYGYTFYSDWLQTNPFAGGTGERLFFSSPQYQLITHTRGGSLDFEDQVNADNLFSANGNYTTAGVVRFANNSGLIGVENEPIGYMSQTAGGFTCYDPTAGTPQPCITSSSYYDVAGGAFAAPTWTSVTSAGPTGYAASGAGATWRTLWNGNVTGAYNTVQPVFINASLSDEWRPNDRLDITGAIRYDNFKYNLPDSAQTADQFYAGQTANYTCVLASTNQVLTQPLPPGGVPPAPTLYVNGDCNAAVAALFPTSVNKTGWVHPNGTVQDGVTAPDFTSSSPGSYSLNYWEPRLSMTYTQNPDTVWRLSAGRYTQPPISASVQYLSASGDNTSLWNNMLNLGFYSPFHPIPGISSAQYDLSWEHQFRGTDMSLKLTPFYTWVSNWQQETLIGAGFATQVPVGVNRIYGGELAFTKGDFRRNGLSGTLALTYTNSKVQFQNVGLPGGGVISNQTASLNSVIQQYDALTKAGGGSPCYAPATPGTATTAPVPGTGVATCTAADIANPYYNLPAQALLSPSAWYNPYSTAIAPNLNGAVSSYISPFTGTLILNYRRNKWAITPSLQMATGGYYGSPLDVNGVDPRACAANQGTTGAVAPGSSTALNCDYTTMVAAGFGQYTYLYVPNPQTGSFAFDSYQQPTLLTGNLQLSYDVSPKISLTLTAANLFHTCFGGSAEPWTAANPPSSTVCGYTPAGGALNSSVYPSNFFNGTGFNDAAANGGVTTPKAFQQSYTPGLANIGAIGTDIIAPLNIFLTAEVRM
jgi:hypothetical protein